jgi:ABC-2 type transport system permease protein
VIPTRVFTKTLYDQRRGFLAWAIGVASLVVLMALMWSSVRDMPGLDSFVKNYPAALRKVFNLKSFTTGTGYLNTELYSLMIPALFLVFSIGHGARLVAGEEDARTLEVLLATGWSRTRVLVDQALALVVTVVGLGAVLFVVTVTMGALVGMGMALLDVARGVVAMTALGIEFGLLALAVSAARGRRGLAIAVPTTVAVAGYVLYILGQIVEAVKPWRGASPFVQALDRGPIGPSWSPGYAVMIGVGVVVLAVAVPLFERRDLGT